MVEWVWSVGCGGGAIDARGEAVADGVEGEAVGFAGDGGAGGVLADCGDDLTHSHFEA